MTLRPAALTIRAADRAIRRGPTGRTRPGSTRTATGSDRGIADRRRIARTGSAPALRTVPGTRTAYRTTIRGSRSAVQ